MSGTILLAEDDGATSEALQRALRLEGYQVRPFADGAAALEGALAEQVDLILLDVMMPVRDGLSVCRELRRTGVRTPILMLTARTEVSDRVSGLDAGADDYLPKPFALDELLARVRALLRRSSDDEAMVVEDLRIDPPARRPGGERSSWNSPRRSSTCWSCWRAMQASSCPTPPSTNGSGTTTSAQSRSRSRCTSATCVVRPRLAVSLD